jgi:hypothetical protein
MPRSRSAPLSGMILGLLLASGLLPPRPVHAAPTTISFSTLFDDTATVNDRETHFIGQIHWVIRTYPTDPLFPTDPIRVL